MNKKLYRDEYHRVFGGVCSGLADYFDMDVTIVRLLFVVVAFAGGFAIIPYIVLWIVLPKKGYIYNNFNNPTVDYRVPPQQPADDTQTTTPPPSSQYGRNPFSNEPYWSAPYTGDPAQNFKPQGQRSHAGIIIGVVLIVLGGIILADNYDLMPDFDFEHLWPVMLVIVGGALIVSGQAKSGWQKHITPNNNNNENQPGSTNTNTTATDETAHEA